MIANETTLHQTPNDKVYDDYAFTVRLIFSVFDVEK